MGQPDLPAPNERVVYHRGGGKVVYGCVSHVFRAVGQLPAVIVVVLDEDIVKPPHVGLVRTIQFNSFDQCTPDTLRAEGEHLWRMKDYLEQRNGRWNAGRRIGD